ncbi:MAG: copper chaperone PCu(A)C [Burkholderiales bacterium]|nr:MAG: copper chaperone PCu(A)C [Burkholderiales bacterium]
MSAHRLPSLRSLLAGIALVAAPVLSFAQVAVGDPWVRATVPQQQASGAFMTLTAPQGARLVGATSPVAGVVEVHEMKREGDVMRMRAIAGLDLPAGRAVKLEPGGYHVMLMSLKQTLNAGDTVPLTLIFEAADRSRQTVEVKAPVRPLAQGSAAPKHKH